MARGQGQIIGSAITDNPYMMYVNNSGAVPMAAYSGTGVYPLLVDSSGKLETTASLGAVTTGSENYIYGKSGTSWIEMLVDATGKVETTASVTVDSVYIASGADIGSVYIKDGAYINVIASGTFIPTSGAVSVTVDSVYIASGADIGSIYLKDGAFVNVMASGTTGIPISGETTVTQATDPWIVLGSVNIDNAVSIGSYTTQTVDGTVSVTDIGIAGSLAVQTVDATDLDIRDLTSVSDSVEVKQSTQANLKSETYQGTDPWIILGSAQITNDVIEVSGNVTVSDDSYSYIAPSGTFYSTINASGDYIPISGIVGVEFSSDYVSVIQSGTPWDVSGTSDVLGSVAITNSVIQVSGDVTISNDSYLNVVASGTTGIPISGETTTTQGTDPWITLGSTQITNSIIEISGNVSISDGATVDVTQDTDPWIVLGSAQITNDVIEISGNTTISDDSYINIAASGTTGIPISGETTTTQGTDPWIVLGSTQITNSVVEVSGNVTISDGAYGVGSISVTTNPVPVSGIYFPGSNVLLQSLPTDDNMNNPMWSLEYDADGNLGSVYQMIGTGSYVNVITWAGYSGVLPGIGSRVTSIGSWSAV